MGTIQVSWAAFEYEPTNVVQVSWAQFEAPSPGNRTVWEKALTEHAFVEDQDGDPEYDIYQTALQVAAAAVSRAYLGTVAVDAMYAGEEQIL